MRGKRERGCCCQQRKKPASKLLKSIRKHMSGFGDWGENHFPFPEKKIAQLWKLIPCQWLSDAGDMDEIRVGEK